MALQTSVFTIITAASIYYIYIKNRKVFEFRDKKRLAYHEAAHAVVLHLKGFSIDFATIRTYYGDQYNGSVRYCGKKLPLVDDVLSAIMVGLAGIVIEEIMYGRGNISTGCDGDIEYITKTINSMICDGFIGDHITTKESDESKKKTVQLYHKLYHKTKVLLNDNMKMVDRVAVALIVYQKINGNQIVDLIKDKPIKLTYIQEVHILLDYVAKYVHT